MLRILYVSLFFIFPCIGFAQEVTILIADGPGDTYELITSVLAPGSNPIEAPGIQPANCNNHGDFIGDDGTNRHIDEIIDPEMGAVFRFFLHVDEDIDRDKCNQLDRQRNEIKSFSQSPDNLLGVLGETVQYEWQFKLDENFQGSGSFTHLHQIKSVGGDAAEESIPLITLTAREASTERLELRYAATTSQSNLVTANLDLFRGNWVQVVETITYGEAGDAAYEIIITNIATGAVLLSFESTTLRMWKTDADFIRPKWGIYRSLNAAEDLRDEEVLYKSFSVTENPALLSVNDVSPVPLVSFFPIPNKGLLNMNFLENIRNYEVVVSDAHGRIVMNTKKTDEIHALDLGHLTNGLYFMKFTDLDKNIFSVEKVLLDK